ncbi:hypothetical protein [Streptomyces fractus]|uniref:hypothetical protein n=1 Tax=Streptomyces fractus TaxID=641806 RepID=UPI003CEE8CD0
MQHSVGTDIQATAQWLDERGAAGAATVLRRTAQQRDRLRRERDTARADVNRRTQAWRSARRRARRSREAGSELQRQVQRMRQARSEHFAAGGQSIEDLLRDNVMMRTDLARFQALVERAGWLPDTAQRRLWRWRNGWWELAYRKRNTKDGYPDTGWYLWGPPETCDGEYTAHLKGEALTEADRVITRYLAIVAEAAR